MSWCGILNVNKPPGLTSRDVVNRVVRLVKPAKVGHAGTLDPLASGVLVICIGKATRLIEFVQEMSKRYQAVFLLGRHSDTEDVEGHVVELADSPRPTLKEIAAAIPRFIGLIQQRPPAYSALKVKGKRAYQLARCGEHVNLPPRPVTIHCLEVVNYEYPRLALEIECSSGTYVRSLGRDLAESLGTASVMSELTRTNIGAFELRDAISVQELSVQTLRERLLPARTAVAHLPSLEVSAAEAAELAAGRFIVGNLPPGATAGAAIAPDGQLLAVVVPRGDGWLGASRNLASPA